MKQLIFCIWIVDAMEKGDVEHIYEITLTHMDTAREINLDDL